MGFKSFIGETKHNPEKVYNDFYQKKITFGTVKDTSSTANIVKNRKMPKVGKSGRYTKNFDPMLGYDN